MHRKGNDPLPGEVTIDLRVRAWTRSLTVKLKAIDAHDDPAGLRVVVGAFCCVTYHVVYLVFSIVTETINILPRRIHSSMARRGYGRVVVAGRARTRYLSIPADVAADDRFPFSDGEEVMVTIDESRCCLLIEKRVNN